MPTSTNDPVAVGRDALDRHAWEEAYKTLSQADQAGSLNGEGLELLAFAAYWTAHPDETVVALERAYGAYLEEGNRPEAAMTAFRVAEQYGMRMALPQAQGWGAKAQRLAEEDPSWPVHGWLMWMQGLMGWFQGDFEAAIASYDRALEFAARSGDRDLAGMSLHDKGHALCLLGRVEKGLAMLDEAMVAVVGGELQPQAAGYVYCGMIGVCSKLGDYRRAADWTEATLRWCERQSVPAFPGVCRVHKAELMRLAGSLGEAEREARLACEELPRFNFLSGLGPAHHEIGEVRRRLGDLLGAEEFYARAHQYGHQPEPGLSLLRMAQGKVQAAAAGIGQALAEQRGNQCLRVRLLAAQAEIALAADDLETGIAASEELDTIMTEYRSESLRAMAACVRGAVRLARGEPDAALPDLREAQKMWHHVDAPFEVAETRLLQAKAQRALGNEEAAVMEARAAREAFEQLGARPAAERAGELLGELTSSLKRPERVGRTFMFTDIVKSTDLIAVIGDEAWENLLTWHDKTLRSLFASHGGEVAHPTGDGFFVAFPDPASAFRCAVAVQRALEEHRRTHGFALMVRIGIHAGEATRRGQDYGGAEVHKAARIAALGEGGEILASEETAGAGDGVSISAVREVSLKGIAETVRVGTVEWR
jgi:class 3 adenylate cyclase